MGGVSTYGIFTMARLGIYASSQGINVTGNNISNINTEGYTRQSLDQFSLHMTAADRYNQSATLKMGMGVLAPSVSQTRDMYLDIRYRNEQTHVGAFEAKADSYNHLSSLLDEVTKGDDEAGVMEAMFNDAIQQLESLNSEGAGKGQIDTLFRASVDTLVRQINKTATDLEALHETQAEKLSEDIDRANYLLDRIRFMNSTIRKNAIYGDNSLEMKDQRNLLIDELSKYMNIQVTYETEEISRGITGEKLMIRTNTDTIDPETGEAKQLSRILVDGIYATQISIRGMQNGVDVYEDVDLDNYDLNLAELTDPHGRTRVLHEEDQGVVKNRDIGPVTNPDNEEEYLVFDTVEEAQAYADELNEDAVGTEFRVVVTEGEEEGSSGITVHEFGTTVYNSSEDATNALIELRQDPAFESKSRVTVNGEVTRTDVKVIDMGSGTFEIHQVELFRGAVRLFDTELDGALLADREMLTEKGVFASEKDLERDPDAAGKRGIPFYQKALDTLANSMAEYLNEANTLADDVIYQTNADGAFIDESGNVTTDRSQYVLKPEYNYYNGGVLLSNHPNGNSPEGITAKNISISQNWSNGTFRVLTTKEPQIIGPDGQPISNSTDNSNLNHFLNVFTKQHDFFPNNDGIYSDAANNDAFFRGTFQELLTDHISATLASDNQLTNIKLDNYSLSADSLYINRDGVMGVDLNDEAMTLMSYQKSYSAACRLMTVFDEMLDKLINGTAV